MQMNLCKRGDVQIFFKGCFFRKRGDEPYKDNMI